MQEFAAWEFHVRHDQPQGSALNVGAKKLAIARRRYLPAAACWLRVEDFGTTRL